MTVHITTAIHDTEQGVSAKVIIDYAAGRAFRHWAYQRTLVVSGGTFDHYATALTSPDGATTAGHVEIRRSDGVGPNATAIAALTREIARKIGGDLPTIIAVDLAAQ